MYGGHTVPSFLFLTSPLLPLRSCPRPCAQAFQPLTSHWQLTSSCLPTLCVPPVYLTPVWLGCEEQSSVYLTCPLFIHALSGAGTLWSLALSLPSDWQLTTGARGETKSPRLASINLARQPHSLHEFSKADGQYAFDENIHDINNKSKAAGRMNAARWLANAVRSGSKENVWIPTER